MNLEQQVVSLELAKKMKELGFEQDSLFAYYNNPYHGYVGAKQLLWEYKEEGYSQKEFCCFAYTVAELGEMLPASYYSIYFKFAKTWYCDKAMDEQPNCNYDNTKSETEADARAKMLIYLKENNLI